MVTKKKAKKKAASKAPKSGAARAAKKRSGAASSRARAAAPKKAAKKTAPKRVAQKAAPKKVAKKALARSKKAATREPAARKPTVAKALRRRDGAGHLDPQYAADLRAKSTRPEREPDGFLNRPRSTDDLVEELGEEMVGEATSAQHEGEDILDQEVPEERGGPFVETTGAEEFGHGIDASNPRGAKREPFPTT